MRKPLREALDRIAALERRVAELEARPPVLVVGTMPALPSVIHPPLPLATTSGQLMHSGVVYNA